MSISFSEAVVRGVFDESESFCVVVFAANALNVKQITPIDAETTNIPAFLALGCITAPYCLRERLKTI
jgi:hypothetical protein